MQKRGICGCMGSARGEGKAMQLDRPLFLLLIDTLSAISKVLRIFLKGESMLLLRYLRSLTWLLIT